MTASQTPEAALLPCPFCGSANVKDRRCEHARDPSGDFDMIGCVDCGAGIIDGTPDAWNRRAPVSGEAVAWQIQGDDGRWHFYQPANEAQKAAALSPENPWRMRALGVLAAHPKPAGEGVEALREAAEQLRFMSANLRQTSDRSEDFKVLFHERTEVADNIDAILSTLSGGLGSRPAAQAVPTGDDR